jgi:signal transduction histidine kinase
VSTPPLRILLIDDDEVDRLAVKRLLRQTRFDVSVDERTDYRSALEPVSRKTYDCILLDYNLPGCDGIEILSELRQRGDNVPVVALTGQGDEEVAVALMKAGAVDYLNKNNLTAERLERTLRYALAIHRAEDERRELLAREQRARMEAQAANRAKDEFLATLSHELRTPLNAILGWSRLLSSGNLDAATSRRAIEIIDRNTRLQAQLIEDLLDISRIITGKLRLELRVAPVREIVDGAVDSVRPSAESRHVALQVDLENPEDGLLCDPSRMQQVLWNLLTNAIKFTPEGGMVRLTSRRDGDATCLSVTDTGAGIEPSFLPYVFDRFRQQDGASTRAHGGLGLGLSIVRHITELHGGTVKAESDGEGRGATFVICVPLAPLRADQLQMIEAAEAAHAAANLPSLAGLRILIVENETDARALMRAVLEQCGATVEEVETAGEALAAIQQRAPDVLLSDIAMPGEDGYSLIRRIRALDGPARMLPAAAFTAYATATDRARALLAGFQAHIPKPVEPSELAAVVAALVGRTTVKS